MSMPVKFEISVVLVGKSLKITIPKEVVGHLKIEKGDKVQMWVDDKRIIVEKKITSEDLTAASVNPVFP